MEDFQGRSSSSGANAEREQKLPSEIKSLLDAIQTLENRLKRREEDLCEVSREKCALEVEVEYLTKQNTILSAEKTGLEGDIDSLKGQKDLWKDERVTLKGENKWLCISNRRLGEQNRANEKEIKVLKRKIYCLQVSLVQTRTHLREKHGAELDRFLQQQNAVLQEQGDLHRSAMADSQAVHEMAVHQLQEWQRTERDMLRHTITQLVEMNTTDNEVLSIANERSEGQLAIEFSGNERDESAAKAILPGPAFDNA